MTSHGKNLGWVARTGTAAALRRPMAWYAVVAPLGPSAAVTQLDMSTWCDAVDKLVAQITKLQQALDLEDKRKTI